MPLSSREGVGGENLIKKILTFRKGAQQSLRVATAVLALAFTTTANAQLGGLLNKAKEAIKNEAKEAVKKEAKQTANRAAEKAGLKSVDPSVIRVVVINDSWLVHYNVIVPCERAVLAWAVYKDKKTGKLTAHDYSFCEDYQGGGKYGKLRYKGIGMRTVLVK